MDFKKSILALLAIFCVVVSACAVSAADVGSMVDDGVGGNQNGDAILGVDSGSALGEVEPGNGLPLENQTVNATGNAAGGVDAPIAGNATGNATGNVTGNVTGNSTGNATSSHPMLATGNPILALFAGIAIVGGYAALRRKD